MVVDGMFVDSGLVVELIIEKQKEVENEGVDFKIRDKGISTQMH